MSVIKYTQAGLPLTERQSGLTVFSTEDKS